MKMKMIKGFTLVEIMIVIAIMGMLAALAMPTFRTWQHRAYGTEALIMAKQILDAQITYFLEHDRYYPDTRPFIEIYHSDNPDDQDVLDIQDSLNIVVPTGHLLDYNFTADNTQGNEWFQLNISSVGGFDIIKGSSFVTFLLDRDGTIEEITP